MRGTAEDCKKKTTKPLVCGVQGFSKSSMLIRLKSSSLGLVVIGSISMSICNRLHGRLANNDKRTTFIGHRSLMPSCAGFLEPKRSRLGPLKSTFNAENFVCSLFWSSCSEFGAICSWNVSRSQKSQNNLQKTYFNVIGHWSWCQSKACVRLPISD